VQAAGGNERGAGSIGPFRLGGLVVALWGRHVLYVMSLAALLSDRGASVRVLEDPQQALANSFAERVRILVLESPLPSELRAFAGGRVPVVVLTEHARPEEVTEALSSGAHALLPKNASVSDLLLTMRRALEQRAQRAPLTDRQHQVLRLLAEGLDNSQIALELGISQRTARAHVSSVLERLGVENRTQAAVTAVRRGYIE
jgi:DNA-binding NarL/FixJ family response regulator